MPTHSLSAVVRDRLASLGLEKIPAPAFSYIESLMARELASIASRKITVASVSRAILRSHGHAVSHANNAPDLTQSTAGNISPKA